MALHTSGPPSPPGPQVHAATLTTATTGAVIWAVQTYLFSGAQVPGPLYVFLQLGVPALCGRLSAEFTYRRARHRLDFPRRL